MNIGIIEPYSDGFLEVLPEGESSDYWQIAAIHINGQAYCPTPQLYRSEKLALAKAAKIYDWIAEQESGTSDGTYYCSPLQLILWQQSKAS
ncbi:conserved hypothetical protein [Trichormus variabilis ATCC 29413]|uniref:Uncharacterized protein n=2 Tax=Anabaena variabilis TaxID=264691 RepID=Q3MFJ6_TRIV2|nr:MULTISPECIES: hypothetical protein [Nostocaceae]ABA20240.1 conserved hypothetical protein [Trichormus variabilis ATCC 29413]MBC1215094.1 hypothetical protein [Trichormus variabilis ARAD]MBC1258631.1 hypothetical protein [Trichormus variabilis V5]MBC1269803.1 hypothetical protein [Trichormus variabilis FSR]MBC1303368.1 hypothetical protein [Trichormus variabilis N2B]